jgi:hypothetical protein
MGEPIKDPCKRSAHQPHATELQDNRVKRLSIEDFMMNDGTSCPWLRITMIDTGSCTQWMQVRFVAICIYARQSTSGSG